MDKLSDEELGKALAPDWPLDAQLKLVAAIPPEKRAGYEMLVWVGNELNEGRIPPGVMVD
ncbi:hypothetical protein OOT33_13875 [Sphingobium sp. DEHP117]|uniref:hypothetical protein n=1 Tax=Sphingobium sp. DEHP117 TaxID=2993436 RepID=UPI0027D603AF|nr:hypothetical protein [Sphingobium sp. DEHP117]MDQ4421511.1 hypothetical protein [Sphingobium sp. DEHP117]